jgi:membrane protein
MDRAAAGARKALARARAWFPIRLAQAYVASEAGNYAGSLAFNAFVSMFPLILGVLAVVGFVIRQPEVEARAQTAIVGFFPPDAHQQIAATLNGIQRNSGILGVISVLGLIYSGTNLFATMEWVLDKVFDAAPRGFVKQRLMGLVMTAVFAVAIVGSVVVTSITTLVGQEPAEGPVIGALVFIGLFLIVYLVVPNRRLRVRDVWPGAVLGGILTEALALLWPVYAGLSHNFNTYGSAFALFFLLASWLYFISQFILIGGVLNRMLLEG